MLAQEMFRQLVEQAEKTVSSGESAQEFPLLHKDRENIDEIVLDSTIDGTQYYLVRRRPRSHNTIRLSPRERAIARVVAQGLPNKCIAKQLNISPWTVASYMRRIFSKLQVTSRTASIAKLMQEDLLD